MPGVRKDGRVFFDLTNVTLLMLARTSVCWGPAMSIYFQSHETACKCCGKNNMNPEFMVRLDKLRERCGFPLAISSGLRCADRNREVGGAENSAHLDGVAVDIAVSATQAYIVLRHAMEMRFAGIGVKQKGGNRFIHVDDATSMVKRPRPAVWSY